MKYERIFTSFIIRGWSAWGCARELAYINDLGQPAQALLARAAPLLIRVRAYLHKGKGASLVVLLRMRRKLMIDCRRLKSHAAMTAQWVLASLPRSALHGLPVEDLYWAAGSGVDLVIHHVFEALVVGGPQEDLGADLTPCEATVKDLTGEMGRSDDKNLRMHLILYRRLSIASLCAADSHVDL